MPLNSNRIWIADLDKAQVLAALYNRAKPQGMGFLHYTPEDMTQAEAEKEIRTMQPYGLSFDYLNGRVMKVDLAEDELRTDLYNRDNGPGAAEEVIAQLRLATNPITIETLGVNDSV